MLTSSNSNVLPALDETLAPITIGRRDATPQEVRAINALNAVLDDQPGPSRTLFDYSGLSIEPRRARPTVNRSRVKAPVAPANERPSSSVPVLGAVMVDVCTSNDDLYGEDYTPAFVAPEFERVPQGASPQGTTDTAPAAGYQDYAISGIATTRDEAIAVASEVQARIDGNTSADEIEKIVADVALTDVLPFGNATLRLFCC